MAHTERDTGPSRPLAKRAAGGPLWRHRNDAYAPIGDKNIFPFRIPLNSYNNSTDTDTDTVLESRNQWWLRLEERSSAVDHPLYRTLRSDGRYRRSRHFLCSCCCRTAPFPSLPLSFQVSLSIFTHSKSLPVFHFHFGSSVLPFLLSFPAILAPKLKKSVFKKLMIRSFVANFPGRWSSSVLLYFFRFILVFNLVWFLKFFEFCEVLLVSSWWILFCTLHFP